MRSIYCNKLWFSEAVVPLQYTGESLGQADKTELDPGLEELLARADATKTWTDKIISQAEVLLQPNPGERPYIPLYVYCSCLRFSVYTCREFNSALSNASFGMSWSMF